MFDLFMKYYINKKENHHIVINYTGFIIFHNIMFDTKNKY